MKPLMHVYTCMKNDITGYSPYELIFEIQPALSTDFILGTNPAARSCSSHSEYVQNLCLRESFMLAADRARKRGENENQDLMPKSGRLNCSQETEC